MAFTRREDPALTKKVNFPLKLLGRDTAEAAFWNDFDGVFHGGFEVVGFFYKRETAGTEE
jgi:hypothetical protein